MIDERDKPRGDTGRPSGGDPAGEDPAREDPAGEDPEGDPPGAPEAFDDPFADLDPVRDAILIGWLAEEDARRRDAARRRRLRELAAPRARRRTRPLDPGDERGASPPIAVRFPRWLEEQLRRSFESLGVTPSEGVRQILEEWWVTRHYPALEYRCAAFRRLPAIRGGPTVVEWLLSDPARPLDGEVRRQVEDFVALARARFEEALREPDRVVDGLRRGRAASRR